MPVGKNDNKQKRCLDKSPALPAVGGQSQTVWAVTEIRNGCIMMVLLTSKDPETWQLENVLVWRYTGRKNKAKTIILVKTCIFVVDCKTPLIHKGY